MVMVGCQENEYACKCLCVYIMYLIVCVHFSVYAMQLCTMPRYLMLSRLDYCNCLLMGTPNSVIQPLQKIQNFAARLVLLAPRHHHSTPLLEKLHWLPISECIKYKVACMCFSAISGSGPAYLSEMLRLVHYTLLLTPAC